MNYPFRIFRAPRFHEMDPYGIVHHRTHVSWCEDARLRLFEHVGLDPRQLLQDGYQFVLTRLDMTYLARISRFGDVEISCELTQPPVAKLHYFHRIRGRRNRGVVAEAVVEIVVVRQHQLLRRIPEDIHSPLLRFYQAGCKPKSS